MRCLQATLTMLLCLYSGSILASVSDATLAEHPRWLALLHFDRESVLGTTRSAVLDDDFFLATDGQHAPQAELTATLDALRKPPIDGERHASCRFPARALWLSRVTGEHWPQAECPEWEEWQQEHAGADVGLMFASGYLGNPASFFGHLMLHLEQDGNHQGTDLTRLLDTSLNFGADVPENDGLATYMAKGLFGGYEAQYSRAPFYRNTALYSEREMRDLWYYRLTLPAAERDLLVAHLYEIIGQDYEYLFLSQNCASRIARTLELVVEDDLTPGHALWVTPESLIRAVADASIDGHPLLQEIEHIPSRRLQTEWRYHDLSEQEQKAARSVWPDVDTLDLDNASYRQLPLDGRAAVLDTLLGHAAFLRQTGDEPGIAEHERRLLQARLELPAGSRPVTPDRRIPLHEATPSGLVRMEGIYNDAQHGVARLVVRPLQYDLLDSNATRMPSAALEIGHTEIDLDSEGARLNELKLFNVTNLHARSVPLPSLPDMAWHASGSLERSRLDCDRCLDGNATLLAGKSFRFGRHLPFVMAGGQLRSERHQAGPVAPMVQLGMLSDWSSGQRSLLQVTHSDGLKGENSRRTRWLLQHRIPLGNRMDVRARLEGDDHASEAGLGLSWYF